MDLSEDTPDQLWPQPVVTSRASTIYHVVATPDDARGGGGTRRRGRGEGGILNIPGGSFRRPERRAETPTGRFTVEWAESLFGT